MPNDMTIEQAVEVVQELHHEATQRHPDVCPYGWTRSGDIAAALTTLLAHRAALEAEVGRLRKALVQISRDDGKGCDDGMEHAGRMQSVAAAALAGEVEGGIEQNERKQQ